MTILDDAREGMNLGIRVQDDLFGHVNGTWLDTAEIPDDRSSWGPFVMLADAAEEHVREIIAACADGSLSGETVESADEARKIGDLFASFMDEERVEQLGHTPILPLLEQIAALSDVSELGAFLGYFERRGGGGLFGSFVDTDDRNSDRYVVNVTQGGIGLPDESYYREEKFAEIREKYVAYLSRIL
ncbi:MAG: peptidase, partial [Marmoricola sp.]|nr:peptidase [Marmoricola sp.]